MKLIGKYAALLEAVAFWVGDRFGERAFYLGYTVVVFVLPFGLLLIPNFWAWIGALFFSLFMVSVEVTALLVDLLGKKALGVKMATGRELGVFEYKSLSALGVLVPEFVEYAVMLPAYYMAVYLVLDVLFPNVHFYNPHASYLLVDFFVYSYSTVFLHGFGDVVAVSVVAKLLSFSELCVSMLLVVIYLGRMISAE